MCPLEGPSFDACVSSYAQLFERNLESCPPLCMGLLSFYHDDGGGASARAYVLVAMSNSYVIRGKAKVTPSLKQARQTRKNDIAI
jgi:hypothetical protein